MFDVDDRLSKVYDGAMSAALIRPLTVATPKRASRRVALLAEAAQHINDLGAGAIALGDIAARVGMTRNALYYYIEDRDDLVFRCFEASCARMENDIAAASEEASATEAITTFVRLTLATDRPAPAVLSDVDYLPDDRARLVRQKHGLNVSAIEGLIRRGAEEGIFRKVDAALSAQMLIGMLSWSILSPKWLGRRVTSASRKRVAACVADLVLRGFSKRGQAHKSETLDVSALTQREINLFDRQQTGEIKAQQLVAAASRLFNRSGIEGVSLDDVGAEAGATKGAIYHYFEDKMDLVARCYERAFDLYELFMASAISAGGSGLQRSARIIHLNTQAQVGTLSPLMPQAGILTLPDDLRSSIIARARRLNLNSTNTIRHGITDGSIRAIDVSYASEASAGAFMWMPKWLPKSGGSAPMELADAAVDLMVSGLVSGPDPGNSRR